jgi:hypothetical protein
MRAYICSNCYPCVRDLDSAPSRTVGIGAEQYNLNQLTKL